MKSIEKQKYTIEQLRKAWASGRYSKCESCSNCSNDQSEINAKELDQCMTLDKIIYEFIPDMRRNKKMPDHEIAENLMALWLDAEVSHYNIIIRMNEIDKLTNLFKNKA